MEFRFTDKRLEKIYDKVKKETRLLKEDGLLLFDTYDINGLGFLANIVRERLHDKKGFYIYNQHINYTNICKNRCLFCAYAVDKDDNSSYSWDIEEIEKRILERIDEPVNELHIVGGLNPALKFSYFTDLLKTVKKIRPNAAIKAFTAVEIDYLSNISNLSIDETIAALKDAGLDMMPGGGAEVMSDRVRDKLFPKKMGKDRWLEIMGAVHRAGLPSNATMLYGHIETIEERVDHLIALRELQDKTIKYNNTNNKINNRDIDNNINISNKDICNKDENGGFSAFIPLAFHSQNTKLSSIPCTTAVDDLKMAAVSRLMLDNFPHIKAYWVMIGEKLAQLALNYGADDLDGTIIEERITHTAGAKSAKGLTRNDMEDMIRNAGFIPVERDSFYGEISGSKDYKISSSPKIKSDSRKLDRIIKKALKGERISLEDGIMMYEQAPLLTLANIADNRRFELHPEKNITFVVDRNINYTNICMSGCLFCAFHKTPAAYNRACGNRACGESNNKKNNYINSNINTSEDNHKSSHTKDGYVISKELLYKKIEETKALGGTQILIQGGMNPALDLDYYVDLLKYIKSNFKIHVHGFSPPEISWLAQNYSTEENLSYSDKVKKIISILRDAGLDSIPGGGAEILCDDIREKLSPNKCTAQQWLDVMETAHELGLKSSATMMFGHIESPCHIFEHLEKIRNLQDKTGGFTAFIPWTFQPDNTPLIKKNLKIKKAGPVQYLRVLALSRIFLDNFSNIQASWVTQGDKISQAALFYGANDMGSTMIEENVVASAGVNFMLPEKELRRLIQEAGFTPRQRDCFYNLIDKM